MPPRPKKLLAAVKLGPVTPKELPDELRNSPELVVEVDAMPPVGDVPGGSRDPRLPR